MCICSEAGAMEVVIAVCDYALFVHGVHAYAAVDRRELHRLKMGLDQLHVMRNGIVDVGMAR